MGRTGLIVEGGGMKCAYSAGVLDYMLKDGITFDYCVGVSAGAANAASFLAGQYGRNERFYTKHITSPDYFGFRPWLRTGNAFNLEYIYGTLSNADGLDPLDYDAIVRCPTEFEIVSTDAGTGKPHYFTKSDMGPRNFRIFMASCALPAICRPVKIGDSCYYDGGVSDSIPIRRALYKGCDRIVFISSKPRGFVKEPEKHRFVYTMGCHRYPNVVRDLNRRHITYNKSQKLCYDLEAKGHVFIFAPSNTLHTSTYGMDPEENRRLYELGCADFEASKDRLAAFLS